MSVCGTGDSYMKKMMWWIVVLATLSVSALSAQDIAGTWQGTLPAGKGSGLS